MAVVWAEKQTLTSIIDNRDGNTLHDALELITENGRELWIATAFFSLDALNMLGENLLRAERIRLLFGDDASAKQRNALINAMQQRSDADLLKHREADPLLTGLKMAKLLIEEGRLEARVYTKEKFHAKLYISHRDGYPPASSIVGSGNFTRSGLTKNIELNVRLIEEQTEKLIAWYEARWEEAKNDDITLTLNEQIERQIKLYEPHAIYLRSLLAWGDFVQGRDTTGELRMGLLLDPHQDHGFRQALKILERENGVMICDGVGLGKSYVALTLMEHFLRLGKRVLLVAPKAILDNSWKGYISQYLDEFRAPFGSLHYEAMTFLGFPAAPDDKNPAESEWRVRKLAEQAEVIIVDESHNFRTTAANRYANLNRIVAPNLLGRKQVVLLSATPINTAYQDLTAQFALLTHSDGKLGGHPIETLKKVANRLDAEQAGRPQQASLFSIQEIPKRGPLDDALKCCMIQRSRATCKELARAAGLEVRFPQREAPEEIEYSLSPLYRELVRKARENFEDLARYLKAYRAEVKRASEKEETINSGFAKLPSRGLKFSAYLPDRYRLTERESNREAQVEAYLAGLVFVNVMKQLESSIVAFQGILQSLGAGLSARLEQVFGREEVAADLEEHRPWINTELKYEEEEVEDADSAEASGEEMDDWIERALRSKAVRKALADFGPDSHDVKRWRRDILGDLEHLREIHEYALIARQQGHDEKLQRVGDQLKEQLSRGRKCLVFTQSKRTARFLESQLPALLAGEAGDSLVREPRAVYSAGVAEEGAPDSSSLRMTSRTGSHEDGRSVGVARVDSDVAGDTRMRILHRFSPTYNPNPDDRPGQARLPGMEATVKPLDVLVCTDVLSEGVNLQEAGCVLNFDIHWNPVRLIQRIGRVDRRLNAGSPEHSFSILNVFPPPEIEAIINLVGTVEGRRAIISETLGIDVSFFRANDEAGTLREFNKLVEGESSSHDRALAEYVRAARLSESEIAKAMGVPPGGFGVWKGAPCDGLFGLFTIEAKESATPLDLSKFAPLLGRPVLALEREGETGFEASEILELLGRTKPGAASGLPSDSATLGDRLSELRRKARESLRDLRLTQGMELRLVCWLELRK